MSSSMYRHDQYRATDINTYKPQPDSFYSNVYYNFVIDNTGSEPIILDKTDSRRENLIDKANDYTFQIMKLSMPALDIPAFLIENQTDYVIRMTSPYLNSATPNVLVENANTQSLQLSSVMPMLNFEDFIENFNRSATACYRDFLDGFDATFGNVVDVSSTDTWDYDASVTSSHDITIAVNHASLTNMKLGYVKLQMDLGNDQAEAGGYGSSDHLFEVLLTSPNGERCYVMSNNNVVRGNTITFEDASINPLNTTDNLTALSGDYQPIESFIKYSNTSNQDGNWTLTIRNKSSDTGHRFHGDITYTLSCYFLPKLTNGNYMKIPNTPPVLAYDQSTNKLEMLFHEQQQLSNFNLSFTKKLDYLLGFDTVLDNSGYERVKLPQVFISATENLYLTQSQPLSTKYLLTDIVEVQIRSNNIPVSGEYDSVSSSAIVMSFNASDVTKDVYVYSADNTLRQYDLNTPMPIRDVNFSAYVKYRTSNVVKPVYVPINTSFTMLVKFKKVF